MSQENQSFTELLIDSNNINIDIPPKKLSDSSFECSIRSDQKCALRIIPVEKSDKYEDYKKDMCSFLKLVTYMSAMHHKTLSRLLGWNIVSIFDENAEEIMEEEENTFRPFIITEIYECSLSKLIDENLKGWDITQFTLFVYGCLRAFRHMNSFNFILPKINKNKILFEKNSENNYLYPIIDDYDNDPKATVSKQLIAFGGLLSDITKILTKDVSNAFSALISNLKEGEDQFQDFHTATLTMEYQIIPEIQKDSNFKRDVFDSYKESINSFERSTFIGSKDKDDIINLENEIKKCNGNRFEIARKTIQLALESNPQAAFKAAISYYNGDSVPKDLVLCIVHLKFSIKYDDNPVSRFFMNSLNSMKDRVIKDSEGELISDEISLYYQGAFHEAIIVENTPAEDDNPSEPVDIDEIQQALDDAIDCYKRSLEYKPTPVVMGRLGNLLLRYAEGKNKNNGIELLKMASAANDIYGMACYANYLNEKNEKDEALKIFQKLEKRNYMDASYLIGKIYYEKGNRDAAKPYFEKAFKVFGNTEAKKYLTDYKE